MTIPAVPRSFAAAGLGVVLDGLPFNQGAVDEHGVEHHLSRLTGWDSPTLRDDLTDRALAHGAYRSPSYYGPRDLSLAGTLVSPHGLQPLRAAKDRLAYTCDLTDTDGVLIVRETPAKRALVRRAGPLRYEQRGHHLVRFELDLTAADPRKYGEELRSLTLSDGQSGRLPNAGTFRAGAPLVVSFTGAGTLTVAAGTLAVTGPATIDTLERTVLHQGASVYQRLVPGSSMLTLPALSDHVATFTGSGAVTVTWRDAWV